jgi:alpha-L-arabinofuranosidase
LDVWVSAPTYQLQNRPQLRYLDVSASYSAKDGALYLNVLNRSKDKDLTTRIENQQGKLEGEVGVWQMNNADLKATHTFGDDKKVRPVTSSLAATVQNNSFSYTFPAHSLTILKLRVKA